MIQIPDSENLITKAFWLCQIRWYAAAGVILASVAASFIVEMQVEPSVFIMLAFLLLLSNVSYIIFLSRLKKKNDPNQLYRVRNHILLQFVSDLVFLTFLLHFSGGIENPLIFFYIFHIIISSILLGKRCTYTIASAGLLLFSSMVLLEYAEVIPHYSLIPELGVIYQQNPNLLAASILIYVFTAYLVVYITSTLSSRLRIAEQRLKNANRELLSKDQIQNEYVKRLTHDIKGHISAIQSNIEVVSKEFIAPLDPKNKNFIIKAHERTLRVSEFIKDLLLLTNMRLNNREEKIKMDIRETVTAAIDANMAFAQSKNIAIHQDIHISQLFFWGFRSSLPEILGNLIQNAIKYTPEKGRVEIKIHSDANSFNIEVKDTGLGIPQQELEHIFDEFYRASNAKSTGIEGTGLGLSLVKAIVERHAGTISVESEANKGSKFSVLFPVLHA